MVLTAFVSPFRAHRDRVRTPLEVGDCLQIHCAAALGAGEDRDPKGSVSRPAPAPSMNSPASQLPTGPLGSPSYGWKPPATASKTG